MLFRSGEEFEEAGEAFVELGAAEGGHALGALHFGMNDAGGAEDFEMMGAGGFGDVQMDFVAGQGPAPGAKELADNGDATGIGQGLHDGRERNVAQGRMSVAVHGP